MTNEVNKMILQQLSHDFMIRLYLYLNGIGLFGLKPECNFYKRTDADTPYVEIFFLREKWHYEMGPEYHLPSTMYDLVVKVGKDIEKWINEQVYKHTDEG